LAYLKFRNRAGREVLRGGTDSFIGDINTIHLNAGGAAEAATKGDRRETILGRIKVAAILNLHARLKLGQIKKVATVDGEILNLFRAEDALYGRLLSVDCNGRSGDFYNFCRLPECQLCAPGSNVADLNRNIEHLGLKSLGFDTDRINAGD